MARILRSNIFARILALLLAVVLWLFVTGDKITRTTPARKVWHEVPLRVENLERDYVITDIPASVDVTLEGLPDDFEDLPMHEIDTFVDLSGKEPGNHLVRVQGRPPRGLSLVLLEPEQVRVTIEAYYSRDFEIELDIIGSPADGWELTNFNIEPEEVLIGAPESIFIQVYEIIAHVDVSNMRLTESLELMPVAYDEEGKPVIGLVMDPAQVAVRLEFRRMETTEWEEELE